MVGEAGQKGLEAFRTALLSPWPSAPFLECLGLGGLGG